MEKANLRPAHRKPRHATALVAAVISCGLFIPIARPDAVNITWDGSAGDWFDPTQWNPAVAPNNTPLDTYLPNIPAGTVTLSTNATVSALITGGTALLDLDSGEELDVQTTAAQLSGEVYLNSGSILNLDAGAALLGASSSLRIDGAGTVDLSGASNWLAGNMSGSGETHILLGATLTITAVGTLTDSERSIVNDGILAVGSPLYLHGGATLVNNGTLALTQRTVEIEAADTGSITGSVYNAGVITDINSDIDAPLYNSGTITAGSTVSLFGGGSSTGVFNAPYLASGFTFGPGPAVGTAHFAAPAMVLDNATLNGPGLFTGNVSLSGNNWVSNASFTSIAGPGSLTVSGYLKFTPSQNAPLTGAPYIHVLPGAAFYMGDFGTLALDGMAVLNEGFASSPFSTVLSFLDGSTIDNTGSFLLAQNNVTSSYVLSDGNSSNAFINTGTMSIFCSAPFNAAASGFPVPIFNTGALTLFVQGNGSYGINFTAGGSASGLFTFSTTNTSAPGSILFSAPYTLNGGALIPGTVSEFLSTGELSFPVGSFNAVSTLTILGDVSASGLTIGAGLNGTGTLTGSGNIWSGGTISGGTVVVNGSLSANTVPIVAGQNFLVNGSNVGLNASSLIISSEDYADWLPRGGISGTLGLSGGSQIQNCGGLAINVGSGAIADLDGNPANLLLNAGTLGVYLQGGGTLAIGVPVRNAGVFSVKESVVSFDGGFTQTAGTLGTVGGTITGVNLSLLGGAIQGNIFAPLTISNTITLAGATKMTSVPTFSGVSPTLDLVNNALVVEAADPLTKAAEIASLQSLIQSANNSGTWTGTGLTSSTLAADAAAGTNNSFHTTLAIVDNGAYPPNTGFTIFAGEPVDANSIILVRALVGDANLDGTVNNTDLVGLLTHFGETGQTQATGDFTGDGTVNNSDLVALLTDFTQTLPGGEALQPATENAQPLAQPAPAPEPASLLTLAIAVPFLFRRNKKPRQIRK